MKCSLRTVDDHGVIYSALMFVCPGCIEMLGNSGLHMLPVNTSEKRPSWTWDGNIDTPTLNPSILTYGRDRDTDRCHSFLRDGQFVYLDDCSHSMAGRTVPMPELSGFVTDE